MAMMFRGARKLPASGAAPLQGPLSPNSNAGFTMGLAPWPGTATQAAIDTPPIALTYDERDAGERAPSLGMGGAIPIPEVSSGLVDVASMHTRKPGFFARDGIGVGILGALGDAGLQLNGMQPVYAPAMQRHAELQRQMEQQAELYRRQQANRQQDRMWAVEDRDAKLNEPDYFMSGRDRVRFDPRSGTSSVVYDGAEDFQTYADTLGLKPGDPRYNAAVQDYVLRGSGPTAQAGKIGLEGVRQDHRVALRSTPTYANLHPAPRSSRMMFNGPPKTLTGVIAPILAKVAQGQPLTAGEQSSLDYYHRPRSGSKGGTGGGETGGSTIREGATATGPGGAKMVFRGGKWVAL